MIIIKHQSDLDALIIKLLQEKIIAIDTEFDRRTTYFAKLSTIQLYVSDEVIIIDVIANQLDLNAFQNVLYSDDIIKIFHAAREDLQIFYNLYQILPKNIFDIQLASNILGYGKNIGYSSICKKILNLEINKSLQTTDWLLRPLTADQLKYLGDDVRCLMTLYKILHLELMQRNLHSIFAKQMQQLLSINNYRFDLEKVYKKFDSFTKNNSTLALTIKELTLFREECAIKANVPRTHFASDDDIISIAQCLPKNHQEFTNLTIKSNYLKRQSYRKKLIFLCKKLCNPR